MKIETGKLYLAQYRNDLKRYDILICYIAVEHYFKTGFIHPYYLLYCKKRAVYVNKKSNISSQENKRRFIKTIKSIERYGFDYKRPVEVYDDLFIKDGIHRLATCLYLGIPFLSIFAKVSNPENEYPCYRYLESAFDLKTINNILKKENELLKRLIKFCYLTIPT